MQEQAPPAPTAPTPAPEPAEPAPAPHAASPPVPPRGYAQALAVPEFRAVFAAHALSLLGVIVSEIALSVLVYDLTGSPLWSALTFALGFLPYAVGGTLLAGVADRFPARGVLVTCDLICAACVLPMATSSAPIGVVLALRCALAVVSPVFQGTRMATLADILGDGDLFVLGRSLLRIVSQSSLLVGYGLGGVLLTVVTPGHALLITVATFLLSAALLRAGTRHRPARAAATGTADAPPDAPATATAAPLTRTPAAPATTAPRRPLLTDSLHGTRQVLADPRVRTLLLLSWIPPMFSVVPEALAAPYAAALGTGSTGLGLLMCALPVGAIAGELYAGARLRPATRERVALPLVCCVLLPYLGYAWHPDLTASLLLLVLSGAGSAYTLGLDQWFAAAVPEDLRGRAMTLLTAGLMTIQGVGMALAGVAARFAGVAATVAGAGVLGTAACAALAVAARRTDRRDGADRDMTDG